MCNPILRAFFTGALALAAAASAAPATESSAPSLKYEALSRDQRAAIDELEQRTFQWFWDSADPKTGLVPDHWPGDSFSSIASVGFALTAYGVGVERGYVTRGQAVDRTLATLRFFNEATQDDSEDGASGYHGFFYHFLDMKTGKRYSRGVELSSVDTTLLLGGVLFSQTYFDRPDAKEKQIRELADAIYRRVDWTWMQPKAPLISMGWTPGGQFIPANWKGYDEGMLVYVLAMGSPTHPVSDDAWRAWASTYPKQWGEFQGRTFLNFAPLFGHQYSQTWVDFRGIQDAWSREHHTDYFRNSREATYAQRSYAIANPNHWAGYGENIWGLTACNGPGDAVVKRDDGSTRAFYGYTARGAGLDYISDDGTIAPTAAGGSIAFAPEIVVPALLEMKKRYGEAIYGKYGFVDAFNPSYDTHAAPKEGRVVPGMGWADDKQIGIDQGPIVLMIENWRSGLVWSVMRRNPYIRRGLERAGFTGGWLDAKER